MSCLLFVNAVSVTTVTNRYGIVGEACSRLDQ